MEPDEAYCEIGCFQGSSLIGALLDNPGRMAYAVDNFAQEQTQEQAEDFNLLLSRVKPHNGRVNSSMKNLFFEKD